MDAELERQVEALFHELADLTPAARQCLLDERCGPGSQLRDRVVSLLGHHDAAREPHLRTPLHLGTPASQRDSTVLPQSIGPYEVVQLLGEGGMGVVYLAEQKQPIRRRVALKVIKLGMDTKAVMARFEAEREALALMDHPHVARVIDAGATEQGRPYFVMEYVEGVPITQFCDRERLNVGARLALFMQVCQAVQHAHQKGIIHRDLKPSNVLVAMTDGQAAVKVIDFGIAKATQQKLTGRTFATEQGILVGTPAYMSPEQADPLSQDIDTRADVYALGVILYELLVGALPLDPESMRKAAASEIQRLIREVDPPKPSTRVSALLTELRTSSGGLSGREALDAPIADGAGTVHRVAQARDTDPKSLFRQVRGDLDWVVMKCLEKDRARRYETAAALLADLRRYLAHEPVTAGPPSATYRVGKFIRRNRLGVAAAAALLLALSAGLLGTTIMFYRAERERARASTALAAEAAQRQRAELSETIATENQKKAEQEAEQAQRDRRKAERVSGFMAEILRGAGPSVAQGRDSAMLREMLDAAAGRIQKGELADAPEAEVTLRRTIGATYADLGAYDRAYELVEPAIPLTESLYGQKHAEVAWSFRCLAEILVKLGKYAEGERLLRESLAMDREIFGEDRVEVANDVSSLGDVLLRAGQYAEAEAMHREALAIWTRLLGEEHEYVATGFNNLGTALDRQGKYSEAEAFYRRCLEMRRRLLGDGHLEVTGPMQNLAGVLERQGKLAEAEVLQRETLDLRRKLLGDEHPRVALSLNNLGVNLSKQGRLSEAEDISRQALAMRLRSSGEEHPDVATSLNNLAGILSQQGKYAEAEELSRRVLALDRKLLGEDHPLVAGNLRSLSVVLERQGEYEEAEELARESLQLCETKLAPDSRERFLAKMALGAALCGRGRYTEAEPLLLEAQEGLRNRTDVSNRTKGDAIQRIVDLYNSYHAAEPGRGFDVKAAEWLKRFEAGSD